MSAAHLAAAPRWSGPLLALVVATTVCAGTPGIDAQTRDGTSTDRVTAIDSTVAFRLRDQFGRVHDAADYRGRVMLLVAAARGGRAAGTAWVGVLRTRQAQTDTESTAPLPVVAVADLRGVPRLLRRIVRAQFPDDARQPVLLDWDGSVARRLALDVDRCTILVVSPDGRVDTRITSTAVDTVVARTILRDAAERSAGAAIGRGP